MLVGMTDEANFGIGALAKLAGVSPDTLRHYERVGVLPRAARAMNGYRIYPPSAPARIQLVRRALALGFTLAELARALRARDAGSSPCRAVRDLAARKLKAVERELVDLTTLRDALRQTLEDWDGRLARTERGRQARLLDYVVAPERRSARSRFARTGRSPQ
jgi:DNA-binding transcriptional MerR regulator